MQLRLVKRLLRLEAQRNSHLPDYQQHYPLGVVVDSHNRRHEPHPPEQWRPSLPVRDWWAAFGGEAAPQMDRFGVMFMGHRKPGLFGQLGQPSTNSYRHLLRQGRSPEPKQRWGSSRLRRLSHLRRPLPPELALTTTHPLQRRRWRSAAQRKLAPTELLKRSETRRLQEQRNFGQLQQYNRWVREIFALQGRELLTVEGGRRRLARHFVAQPRSNYQLHYPAHRPTPLWVYAAGLRPHLPPLAADRHWWRRVQRPEGQKRPRSFWSGYVRASQRLLRRERWLQLRLERYPLELLRSRFDRSLEMAQHGLLVADSPATADSSGAPRFWNKWTPLRRYLGRQWRYLLRFFSQREKLRSEPMLLGVQLTLDFHLLQLNLVTLQRQELLEPQRVAFKEARLAAVAHTLLDKPHCYPLAARQLRRELRQRVADRGAFGALLEPLLRGRYRSAAEGLGGPLGYRGGFSLGGAPGELGVLRGRSRSGQRVSQKRRQNLVRQLGQRVKLFNPEEKSFSTKAGLLLPRPLGRLGRRLGFEDYLVETLGVAGPTASEQHRLGRGSAAAAVLLQRPTEREPLPQTADGPGGLFGQPWQPQTEAQSRSRLGRLSRSHQSLQTQEQLFGRGYTPAERLRSGGLNRGNGARQVCLRGRREGLLSGYLNVETDLHPFRGWPVDYHREQCWDFWKLDRSLLPQATLDRLNQKLEELPRELQNYLMGRPDYYTPEQSKVMLKLRGRDREDYEKRVLAELKKLCPPATNQDRLETDPIWQPGLEWWKPRYVAQASLHYGRPRRRCTHGTNLGARAPARLYQRVFLPRLMGALEGDYKMIRQLVPYTLHHPYSYRWTRLGRRYRHYGISLERFMRWGPEYGRRVNRRLEMGRSLKPRLRRRLFTRPRPDQPEYFRLPARDWRLRLRQLRRKQKTYRKRGYSLSWMNHSITRVRTDARANLVTGVISHVRWSYDYVLRRRKVLGYRRSRKQGRRLELRLRRWCHRQQVESQRRAPESLLAALLPRPHSPNGPARRQRRQERWLGLQRHRRRWRLLPRRRLRRRRHDQRSKPAPAESAFKRFSKTPADSGSLNYRDIFFLAAPELPARYRA